MQLHFQTPTKEKTERNSRKDRKERISLAWLLPIPICLYRSLGQGVGGGFGGEGSGRLTDPRVPSPPPHTQEFEKRKIFISYHRGFRPCFPLLLAPPPGWCTELLETSNSSPREAKQGKRKKDLKIHLDKFIWRLFSFSFFSFFFFEAAHLVFHVRQTRPRLSVRLHAHTLFSPLFIYESFK